MITTSRLQQIIATLTTMIIIATKLQQITIIIIITTIIKLQQITTITITVINIL